MVKWGPHSASPRSVSNETSFWDKAESLLLNYLGMQGRIAEEQGQLERLQGQQIAGFFQTTAHRAFAQHEVDTIGVTLDAIAVVLTVGFASGILATVALGTGLFLLAADGTARGLKMAGNDEGADTVKYDTAPLRWAAIIATVPDAVYGLCTLAREALEALKTTADLSKLRSGAT